MSAKKFTGTIKVWLPAKEFYSADDLAADTASGKNVMGQVHFARGDMSKMMGWLEVGMATVEVTLHPLEEMTISQLEALQAELHAHRADAKVRENEILNRISKLQATQYTQE